MPVKNAGQYLKPCLNSIVAQTYTDWELIAINDSSHDGSEEVLEEYAEKYSNIVTYDSSGAGIVKALQLAFKLSSGDSVHRMDADDLMPPNKLELMFEALEIGSIVTGMVSYFCDEREVGEGFSKYTNWLNGLMESGDFWRDVYLECPIPSSAWLTNRVDFERIGGFESSLMPEDYDLSFRVLKHKLKVIRLNKVVHHWRDSETRTSRNVEQYFPIAYLPLKVRYFIEIDRNINKELLLWGAGKKGKIIAKLLIEKGIDFKWVTNNNKKKGVNIYGKILESSSEAGFSNSQIVLAISSPSDKKEVLDILNAVKGISIKDCFWFC
ncbi:glycosyltransferase family 2 protein [Bacteroidia bacterium]|nr:glycosyltransferase family 2 protein [Bacteroidia bacterium]